MLDDIVQLFKLTGLGVALMLPLANPLTSMTLLLSLGQHLPYKERQRQIKQAAVYVVAIMLVTYYAGALIMQTFGISVPGLRIAGGLIVAFIGFTMLFPTSAAEVMPEAEKKSDALQQDASPSHAAPNIALVPLALPGTAGPGTIAMIVSAASSLHEQQAGLPSWVVAAVPVIVFVLLGVLFWVCLHWADRVVAIIGQGGVEAIARIMGFLLVCMAVQFVIDGVLAVIAEHGRHA